MTHILFATSNQRKINEANDTLGSFGISTQPVEVEIDEIQHSDPAEITKAKAVAAFSVLQKPVVVSDTSWSIPALGGFPGGYMKDVNQWWSEQDWLNIMAPHENKTIICREHLAYYDGKDLVHFSHDYTGVFLGEARGSTVNEKESFERVASLNGSESLTEARENAAKHSEKRQLPHWLKFGEWFGAH